MCCGSDTLTRDFINSEWITVFVNDSKTSRFLSHFVIYNCFCYNGLKSNPGTALARNQTRLTWLVIDERMWEWGCFWKGNEADTLQMERIQRPCVLLNRSQHQHRLVWELWSISFSSLLLRVPLFITTGSCSVKEKDVSDIHLTVIITSSWLCVTDRVRVIWRKLIG